MQNENVPNGQTEDLMHKVVDKANEVLKDPHVEKKARKAVAKARKASAPKAKGGQFIEIGPSDYDRVVLPDDENDPHWDPKLRNPVPEGVVESLADFGWDPSSRAIAINKGKKLEIIHGKTRWRALEKANKHRKAAGLDPIVAQLLVVDEDAADEEAVLVNMEKNATLNYGVQRIDPMTTAESITRMLSAGRDEKTVAKRHSVTVNDLHGYLLLTDENKCPPKVQEMLREGLISFTAALEFARRADKMTKGEITAAAEAAAKAAAGGVRVTSAQVARAAGAGDEKVATKKEVKQFLLDLQSDEPGKGEWGAIVGLEVGLGTRSIASARAVLAQVRKGKTPKIDFKQYQDGSEKAVKGQEK